MCSLFGIAQENKEVNAQFLYSYYNQDGNNSVVTGGTGTELLDYHGPAILVNVALDSSVTFNFKGGVDVYSSASQDNIDFHVSSASAKDARSHFTLGLNHNNEKKELDIEYHAGFSIESDYTSLGFGASVIKGFKNYQSTFSASLQVYLDDCRWGRLSAEKELTLLYPFELRDGTEWETEYLRQTYALSLSYGRLINKRLKASIFIEPTFQNGLLATTFHRIYFNDGPTDSVAIEKLPYQRFKLPIGIRLNYFLTKKVVLRSYYRFYADDWNIKSHTIEIETPIKLSPFLSIYPFYRYYVQNSVFWFKPYGEHSSNQTLFTSDYDLSAFTAHKYGVGFSWKPLKSKLNYNFRLGSYWRSDGLKASFVSVILGYNNRF